MAGVRPGGLELGHQADQAQHCQVDNVLYNCLRGEGSSAITPFGIGTVDGPSKLIIVIFFKFENNINLFSILFHT